MYEARSLIEYGKSIWQQIVPPYTYIDLSRMGLQSLDMSMIPATCEILCLGTNQFRTIPTPLPPRLKALYIETNCLTSIPDGVLPPTLEILCAPWNEIRTGPTTWPPGLTSLYLGFNRLETLPPLPPTLTHMTVQDNRLLVDQTDTERMGPALAAYGARLFAAQARAEEEAARRRSSIRLQCYVDELLATALHPDRVGPLFRMGRFDTLV